MTVENERETTKEKSVTAGLQEDPNRLVVVKNQGCDWGVCERPRRRDLATSLALRDGHGEADPHAGKALATEGYRCAQAFLSASVLMLWAAAAAGSSSSST